MVLARAALSFLLLVAQVPDNAPATVPTSAPTSTPTTAPYGEITALVAQLAGEDAAARDAAQETLLDFGEDALPALEAARKTVRDPDLQIRLDTLLVQIRERADIGASKVTLKFEDAPLDQVLASFAKQARAEFAGDLVNELGNGRADGLPRVTLDLENVSFWRALQEIQDAANVIFYPQAEGWRVSRNFGQAGTVRGSEAGAFLIQPTNASYTRSIVYARNMGGDSENFSLQFQALAEPKIKLTNGVGMMTIENAVDSNGNDLLAQQRTQQIGSNGQNGFAALIQLKYPKNPGEKIAEIRGTLRISIARRTQRISSDDVMNGGRINATVDGAKIHIDPSPEEAPPNGASFSITIDTGGDVALGQRLQQNMQQMTRVTDSRDAPMRTANFNITRSDARGLVMRLVFMPMQPQNSKGPYKLQIEVPTSFREVEVPFVMKDLKMP